MLFYDRLLIPQCFKHFLMLFSGGVGRIGDIGEAIQHHLDVYKRQVQTLEPKEQSLEDLFLDLYSRKEEE